MKLKNYTGELPGAVANGRLSVEPEKALALPVQKDTIRKAIFFSVAFLCCLTPMTLVGAPQNEADGKTRARQVPSYKQDPEFTADNRSSGKPEQYGQNGDMHVEAKDVDRTGEQDGSDAERAEQDGPSDAEELALEPLDSGIAYSLQEVMQKAMNSPSAVQAIMEARAAQQDVESLENSIYLPRIGVGYTYETKDRKLFNDTLIGPIGGVRKDYGQGALEVNQTLFDAGAYWYRLPAARSRRDAALSGAEWAREEAALKAARDYFMVLRLQARRAAVADLVRNLQGRYGEMYRLYRFGRVSSVDLTRVQLALSDARAGLDEIQRSMSLARLALGQSIGESREVDAQMPERSLPDASAARELFGPGRADLNERKDLQALQKQIEAQKLEKEELEYWTLPVFFARAALIHNNSGQVSQRNWASLQAGVQLPLYESGTRETRRKAAEERLKALEAKRKQALQGYRLELESRLVAYDTAVREANRLARDLQSARAAAYAARSRFASGQGTANEVLDAENLLFDTYDRYGQARIDRFLRYYELAFSAGQLLRLHGIPPEDSR